MGLGGGLRRGLGAGLAGGLGRCMADVWRGRLSAADTVVVGAVTAEGESATPIVAAPARAILDGGVHALQWTARAAAGELIPLRRGRKSDGRCHCHEAQ